jgi:hypothetical protein
MEVFLMVLNEKQINRAIMNVNATLWFEGVIPSSVAHNANKQMLRGEISGEEARDIILSNYNLLVE